MKLSQLTLTQKRILAGLTLASVLFAAYFLSLYFTLIVVAAIFAFLFTPIYKRLQVRMRVGWAATLTFFTALLMVILPLAGLIFLAVVQITSMVDSASDWASGVNLSDLGNQVLAFINNLLNDIPYVDYQLTQGSVITAVQSVARDVGTWMLGVLTGFASNLFSIITASIIFVYVFFSLLVNQDKLIKLFRQLNPLGEQVSDLYLSKSAAMVRGTVKGQFIIAVCQGLTGAASVYIAGIHEAFFVFAILFTALSLVPLGSGIITIPLGIGMMLFGNIWGGLFVILWHLFGVSNIDNILRPILIPRAARLDPALMLLAVFAGLAMFGFWGIVLGPVLMILVVTTIRVYLAVFKSVPLEECKDEKKWRFNLPKFGKKKTT